MGKPGANADRPIARHYHDDGLDCNINSAAVPNTGARAGCVSRRGAMDMVGNVEEWMQGNGAVKTGDTGASFGKDGVFGVNARGFGAAADPFPPALIRRGSFGSGSTASGVCSLDATLGPDGPLSNVGFRRGRPKYLVGACWPWRRDSGWK